MFPPSLSQNSSEDWEGSGELHLTARVWFLGKAQAIRSAVFASQ